MTDSGRTKGPICGIDNCRSRFYEEGDDGYLYCQNGHRKGELLTQPDDEDFNSAKRTRTRAKKPDDEKEQVRQYFKGTQAFDLYLKSLQLILRHQIRSLVHDLGLPAELETVVLDLWAIRILPLEEKLSEKTHDYDSQSQGFDGSDDEAEIEEEMIRFARWERKLKTSPTLMDCLALCYLGIVTLRLPVTPGDLDSWVTDGKIPYMGAIKRVPLSMRDRLPANYHAVLDPNSLLKLNRFYSTLADLQASLQKEYGIIWPPLNSPLLRFRYIKELALPLEIYAATDRLAGKLGYDLVANPAGKKRRLRGLPEAQLIACLIVCVKIMYPFDGERRYPRTTSEPAVMVIDWDNWHKEISEAKTKADDSGNEYTNKELWNVDEKDVLSMSPSEMDQYMDFYQQNFLDEARLDQEPEGGFQDILYKMFPIHEPSSSQTSAHASDGLGTASSSPTSETAGLAQPEAAPKKKNRKRKKKVQTLGHEGELDVVTAVHKNSTPLRAVTEEELHVARPGQGYRHYEKEEELSKTARQFYEEAARIAGFSMEMVVKAVVFVEKDIRTWIRRRKQASRNNETSGWIRHYRSRPE
ncbi:hypothetical protein BDV95DRAFT_574423 [Massariosphaeria phaeospora]|uniref:Uncharacterized protein n=1 Tax=Massariosphaeria phaeospora TaxID=100035 RepID=A0A7C8I9J8_9PLEO|nr:hypothetical protein BDV95DRAFT_574423 [Massariosphaeria phaeospora]